MTDEMTKLRMFSSSMTFFTVYILGEQYTNRPAIQVCQYIPIVGIYIPITPISKCLNSSKSTATNTTSNTYENPFIRIVWYAAAYTVYGIFFESPWEMKSRMSVAEISNYPYKESKYGNFIYTDATNYNITRFDLYNRFLIESKNLYGNDIGVDFAWSLGSSL